jgi:glycosyltransferase involved in cell wall biosynthesis
LRLLFVAERQVGIGAVASVVQRFAQGRDGLRLTWVDVTYQQPGGLLERLPLPRSAGGVLRGYLQSGRALWRGKHDAQLFLTHNPAVLHPVAVALTPTCLWTDVTPLQLDEVAEAYEHRVDSSRLVRALKHGAVKLAFRAARRCLAWSEWARRSFVADYGVPEQRTAVVAPGVDLAAWEAPDRARPDGAPLKLLFVGGDFRRKGGLVLLAALQEARIAWELDVVTREDVSPLPGVRVHRGLTAGSEPLRRLYREADAFVLPTLADCHSIASLEAMAAALPVVSTHIAANPEIIAHGESGLLVPPGDPRALLQALESLAADRARLRSFGRRGRALAEERFDARRTVDALLGHARAVQSTSTR